MRNGSLGEMAGLQRAQAEGTFGPGVTVWLHRDWAGGTEAVADSVGTGTTKITNIHYEMKEIFVTKQQEPS